MKVPHPEKYLNPGKPGRCVTPSLGQAGVKATGIDPSEEGQ